MITAIVGHRGTGKSTFLERLKFYLGADADVHFADLDTEIEKKIGKSIPDLFKVHGEEYFRDLERQMFTEFLQKPYANVYIVLGAGFDVSIIPESVNVLWVRRDSDLEGRIFLDRPRLNLEVDPLTEYRERALLRETKFSLRADDVYLMPPGDFAQKHLAMQIEKKVLLHEMKDLKGIVTVLPDHFRSEHSWKNFKSKFLESGLDFFEIRDDLLTIEQIEKFFLEFFNASIIFSLRKPTSEELNWSSYQSFIQQSQYVDWAYEVGNLDLYLDLVPLAKRIGSLHEKENFAAFEKLAANFSHLKYAPLVNNFEELKLGHQWQVSEDTRRSFLPRSLNGRWAWYRLRMASRQKLQFIREGMGSALDQPTLWQWQMEQKGKRFAAVLGDPVLHSFTPMEQSDFFAKYQSSVYAIEVAHGDFAKALSFLQVLGLSFAAVTSPLKELAQELCQAKTAINTLYWNGHHWQGTNTDDRGFLALIEGVGMLAPLQNEIVVWGGGGTLEMIAKGLPHARYYSARTGDLRSGEADEFMPPRVLVWAAPRLPHTLFPPSEWKPVLVIDLNYKEDSLGKEYAQRIGANYQSGLAMFVEQALGQRQFWKAQEG